LTWKRDHDQVDARSRGGVARSRLADRAIPIHSPRDLGALAARSRSAVSAIVVCSPLDCESIAARSRCRIRAIAHRSQRFFEVLYAVIRSGGSGGAPR
jgi:hypothetical protein